MNIRPLNLALLLLCTAFAGTAMAKKSSFKVKNCTDEKLSVYAYDGDDAFSAIDGRLVSSNKQIKSGETKELKCKVKSGKRRCRYSAGFAGSAVKRIKNGRTVYINQLDHPRWNSNTTGCWAKRKIRLKASNGQWLRRSGERAATGDAKDGAWRLVTKGDGKVSLQSVTNRRYLSARGADVRVDRSRTLSAETFTMTTHSNGKVSFKSSKGKYLVVKAGKLEATGDRSTAQAQFKLVELD